MSFYLPLMINNRRLHVCHLQERNDEINPLRAVWGFILSREGSQMLINVDALMPNLISQNGDHIVLDKKYSFAVRKAEQEIDGLPTYLVILTESSKAKELNDPTCGLKVEGQFGHEDDRKRIKVLFDSTVLTDREVVIVVEGRLCDNVYNDAFRCFLCPSFSQAGCSAALDFGSEASQIRISTLSNNTAIISTLEDMMQLPKSDDNREYWQGKPSEFLFKSIFWVDHAPKLAKYADIPHEYRQRPLVSPLLPATALKDDYKDLELLPNLKIVELSQQGGVINFDANNINLPNNSDLRFIVPNLADAQMRSSVLRVILSNFLHVILHSLCSSRDDKYLRMILMVPNVYFQDKVFDMIRGVYEDFYKMKAAGLYSTCKGIEVQAVSESDAAFIGAKSVMTDSIVNAAGSYFLNIDSGKGTTDFSIMNQQKNYKKYVSVYRDGIPAAGNVLTYAYYEAFHDFMMAHGIDIHPWIEKAEKAHLIKFMRYIEDYKVNREYEMSYEYLNRPLPQNVKDLTSLLTYMENNRNRNIPCITKYVEKAINALIGSLENSIKNFTSIKNISFKQVVLSGRALLYKPFYEALVNMLIKNHWIHSPSNVVWVKGNLAKTCCLEGALRIESECDVNFNSGLIGSPLIHVDRLFNLNWLTRIFGGGMTKIDKEFFYEGSKPKAAYNVSVQLGCRRHMISGNLKTEKRIFFIGDRFATQDDNECLTFLDPHAIPFSDPNLPDLVNKSLFPYFPGTIVRPAGDFFMIDNRNDMKTNVANSTSVISSVSTTNRDDVDA